MASVKTRSRKTAMKIDGLNLKVEDVYAAAHSEVSVKLTGEARKAIEKSRESVLKKLQDRKVVYGITTGFGKFKDVFIQPENSLQLQRNFILSHAAGVGPLFESPYVRAITLLRANALAKGFSGIRVEVV